MRPILALALSCLVAAAAAQEARPDEAEAERRLQAVRDRIAELVASRIQLQGRRGAAERALREADRAVSDALAGLRRTESELTAAATEIERLRGDRDALDRRLDEQRRALAAMLRHAYAVGRDERLKLLLAQDRLVDLGRASLYHRYLRTDRGDRIRALLAELRELADVSERLEAERDALASARDRRQGDLIALESARSQRREFLAGLDTEARRQAERMAELTRDEHSLSELLRRLRDVLADVPQDLDDGKSVAQRRGALPRPLAGPVLSGFGARLPDGRTSQGWLIAGAAGTEVQAVSHGRVAYADWLKGYGLILILDHGDGWMSLYAHNDALLKNPGDWVGAGEAVASVGSSGGMTRPALYFELRRDGRPVDPREWLRGR